MTDLKSARAIRSKAVLLLVIGLVAAGLLVAETPTLRTVVLLGVAVWAFCRAYYFAFYVIQHYVDPGYRFSGLGSFVRYMLRKRDGR